MNNVTNPTEEARRRRGSCAKPHARSVSERSWGRRGSHLINLGEVVTHKLMLYIDMTTCPNLSEVDYISQLYPMNVR